MSHDGDSFLIQSDALFFADFNNHAGDFMCDDIFRASSPAVNLPLDTNMPDINFVQTRDELLASIATEDESIVLRGFESPKQEPTTSSDSDDFLVSGPPEAQAHYGLQQETQPSAPDQQQQMQQASAEEQQQKHVQNAHSHMFYHYQRPLHFPPQYHLQYPHFGQQGFHGFSQSQPMPHFQSPWFQQQQMQPVQFPSHFHPNPSTYRAQQQKATQALVAGSRAEVADTGEQRHAAAQQQISSLCSSSVLAAIPPPIMQNPIMQTVIPPAPIPSAAKRNIAPPLRPPFLMPPHFINGVYMPHYPALPPPHSQQMLSHSGMPLSLSAPPDMYTMRMNFLPPSLACLQPPLPNGSRRPQRHGTVHEKETGKGKEEKQKIVGSSAGQDTGTGAVVGPQSQGDKKLKSTSSRLHNRVAGSISTPTSAAAPTPGPINGSIYSAVDIRQKASSEPSSPQKAQPRSGVLSLPETSPSCQLQDQPSTSGTLQAPPIATPIPQFAGPPMHAPNLVPTSPSTMCILPSSLPSPEDPTSSSCAHLSEQVLPCETQQGLMGQQQQEAADGGDPVANQRHQAEGMPVVEGKEPELAPSNKQDSAGAPDGGGGASPTRTLCDGSTSTTVAAAMAAADRPSRHTAWSGASESGSASSRAVPGPEVASDASNQTDADGDCLRPLPQLDTAHSGASRAASAMQRSFSSHALGQLGPGGGYAGGRYAAPLRPLDPSGEVPYGPDMSGLHHTQMADHLRRPPFLPPLGGMRRVQSAGDIRTLHSGLHMGLHHMLTPSPFKEGSFRVGRYSREERQLRISRYRQKRAERNFNKKIKYSCRKVLADSRPRVRGRFAKNDDMDMEEGDLGPEYDIGEDDVYLESPSSGEQLDMLGPLYGTEGPAETAAGSGWLAAGRQPLPCSKAELHCATEPAERPLPLSGLLVKVEGTTMC